MVNSVPKIQLDLTVDLKNKISKEQTRLQEESTTSTRRPSMSTVINLILEEYFNKKEKGIS